MAFQMGFTKEEISGAPAPAGWYDLQVKGFKPRAAKNGESVSFNAECAIINHPDYEGKRVFVGLNTKMMFMYPDFVHSLGLEMEVVQNEDAGTDKELLTLPGAWEGYAENPDDPSKWKYLGPMLNKTFNAELAHIPATTEYKAKNEIRQFKCALPGCTEKHSTNLIREKKD